MRIVLGHLLLASLTAGCGGWNPDQPDPYDVDFDLPRTEAFPPLLSAYGLYASPAAALDPAPGVLLYELSAELYSDQADKQRLMKVPGGTTVSRQEGAGWVYPEGTVLAKTFFYRDDLRVDDAPRRLIETRLLVKTDSQWNVATYVWNDDQTDATLLLDGTTTEVTWVGTDGAPQQTTYAVPHEGECVTCHQAEGAAAYIGPSERNLNREVLRDGRPVNQLDHLVDAGVLAPDDWTLAPAIDNYKNADLSPARRARAYLDANCAHCHSPGRWDEAAQPELDLRAETPLDQTGLARKADDLVRQLENGEMPYLGVTLPDEDGIQVVLDYVQSL